MKNKFYGLIFCLLLAFPAWKLGKFFPLIGGPVFGIIIGIFGLWFKLTNSYFSR